MLKHLLTFVVIALSYLTMGALDHVPQLHRQKCFQYDDYFPTQDHNRFHYYDPGTGAYISQDPIGLARASTIEAQKIREQIAASKVLHEGLSIKQQLAAAGLRNKNRGRDIEKRPFNPHTMGGSYSLLSKPERVKGLKKYKK